MSTNALARRIAADLFVNGNCEVADRLQLKIKRPDGSLVDGGDYCFSRAVDVIEKNLAHNLFFTLE